MNIPDEAKEEGPRVMDVEEIVIFENDVQAATKKEEEEVDPIGKRVKVWWPSEGKFYTGLVCATDSQCYGSHLVLYDNKVEEFRQAGRAYFGTYAWFTGPRPSHWDDPDPHARREVYQLI